VDLLGQPPFSRAAPDSDPGGWSPIAHSWGAPGRWRFQYSLATLISVVIFANLGLAIYYTRAAYVQATRGQPMRTFNDDLVLAVSPDGRRALSGRGIRIRLWEIESGKELWCGNFLSLSEVTCAAISPDGGRALIGDEAGNVRLWDLETGREIRKLGRHQHGVGSVVFSLDGSRALSTGHWSNSMVLLWDLRSGREIGRLAEPEHKAALNVTVSLDWKRAL